MLEKTSKLAGEITQYIQSHMPLKGKDGITFDIKNLKVTIPEENFDLDHQLNMKNSREGNTEGYVSGTVVVQGRGGNKLYNANFKKLVTFPVATERGSYIVKGIEKNIISQMRMKPGVYTNRGDNGTVKTQMKFSRGSKSTAFMPSINFVLNPTDFSFNVAIKSYGKDVNFNIVNFMRILGFSDGEIRQSLGSNDIADEIMKKSSKGKTTKSMDDLYKIFFPKGNPNLTNPSELDKRKAVLDFFSEHGKFGDGSAVSATLGMSKNNSSLNKEVIAKAVKKTLSVANGLAKEDVKDDLKFKDVYSDTDLIFDSIADGLDKFFNNIQNNLENYDGSRSIPSMLTGMNKTIHSGLNGSGGLMNSEISLASEEINPLFMEAKKREITQGGPGGMTKDGMRNETDARNLTNSGINKIDPVETPESGKIGMTQHLTVGAKISDKTIKNDFYKVVNGEVSINDKNKVEMSPIEEENHVIAFNDSRYVEHEGGKYKFTQDRVPARYNGKIDEYPVNKVEYLDIDAKSMLGTATNMIPFVGHDDGARALMGAAMQKQAVNLKHREDALVKTVADVNGKTFDEKMGEEYGRPVKSTVAGIVQNITNSKIIVVDEKGKENIYQYYNYFPLNQSYINNELKVKVGDKVVPGQILAEGWQTKDGKLALGVNTRIGYMPYKGHNYEDGVVISDSFAKKMTSKDYSELEFTIPKGAKGGRGSNIKPQLAKETVSAALSNFDNDGIVKVGTNIKDGSVLLGFLKPIEKNSDDLLDIIAKGNGKTDYKYSEKTIPANSYVAGKIVRISVVDNPDAASKQKIIFSVAGEKPLKPGDKIAGRHGNKGTITKILPDNLMPEADGRPLDLLMSPLAVPSRKNPGQILEAGAGLIAEKTGKPYIINNFDHKEKQRVLDDLKKIGVPDGKMKVTLKEEDDDGNIIDVPVENPVTVGNAYFMKLKHKVDDKVQSRSNRETHLSDKTHMPSKVVGSASGEKFNPQRLGEMEMRGLQGHGAAWNILESSTIKADGGGTVKGKAAIFKALATGKLDANELSKSARPETVKVLTDTIKTLGFEAKPMYNGTEVTIDKPFNSIGITPLNEKKFLENVGEDKEVFKSKVIDARRLYGDKKSGSGGEDDAGEKGGILDSNIFGKGEDEEDRNKWGYIKLPVPVPNPMFMEDASNNVYSRITGLKTKDLRALIGANDKDNRGKGAKAVITDISDLKNSLSKITDPNLRKSYEEKIKNDLNEHGFKKGQIVDVATLDKLKEDGVNIPFRTGGTALEYLLEQVDVNKGIKEAKKELDTCKAKDLDAAYKKYKAFEMLKNNNMEAKDLMMNIVPVTPTYLRPVIAKKEDRSVIVNDMNHLYNGILRAKEVAEKGSVLDSQGRLSQEGLGPNDIAQRSRMIYDSVRKLQGSKEAKDGDKILKSTKDLLKGKEGLIRKEMLAKREDFSGRSVITVNPNLGLDEVGIPLDMARNLYKPFIIKELVKRGICKNEDEASSRVTKANDPLVRKVMQDVVNDRPAMLNRQPTLHKFSLQALKPIVKEYEGNSVLRSIELNPLVVTGFNADFDGDTMAVHVPITEKAKEEAKKLMLPSTNLINPTDGSMVVEIRHEMALGIYQLTNKWDKPEGKTAMVFNTYKDLLKAYMTGKVGARQKVRVPICQLGDTTAGQALFNWIIPDKISKYRDFRKVWTKKEISKLIKSVYIDAENSDFKTISKTEIADLLNKIKDLGFKASTRTGISLGVSDFQLSGKEAKKLNSIIEEGNKKGGDVKSWKEVEDKIEDELKKGLLPSDNALQVMMNSGARANAQQIRKMFSTIGIGMDVSKNILDPIKGSHFDGLSPQEFYQLGKDSRKGMYDRAVSTSEPGALSREVWSASQDVIINEKDCGTHEFINIKKNDATIKGRYAGKDILDKDGHVICKKNQMIKNEEYNKIYKDDSIEYVPVRSPLRCKTKGGKCQMCYGALSGTIEPVKIGTAVGVIASQAIGEPVTQMTMNTFHTGGANSAATLGLPRVKTLLNLGVGKTDKATLAKVSGTVENIEDTPREIIVTIGKTKHSIPKIMGMEPPVVKVKRGDTVKAGDFLTAGDSNDIMETIDDNKTTLVLTNAKPSEMFNLKKSELGQEQALMDTRDYLTNSMQYAFKKSNAYMDRRHSEVIVSKLTGTGQITDPGDSPYLRGQKADINLFEKWNSDNCKGDKNIEMSPTDTNLIGRILAEDILNKGKVVIKKGIVIDGNIMTMISKYPKKVKVKLKPIEYDVLLTGKNSVQSEDNWLSNTAIKSPTHYITQGAAMGSVDKLDDPRSRLMTGKMLNVGEGAKMNEDAKSKIPGKMSNFFTGAFDKWLGKK